MRVVLYSSPKFPHGDQAEQFLSEKGVPFIKYDVSADQVSAHKVARISGQSEKSVVTIDDQVVIGFDRPRLERLLGEATQ